MLNILALDLSKRSTGWAVWTGASERPQYGHWQLGSEFTSDGQTYAKLHQNLSELRMLARFDALYYEQPLNQAALTGHTNVDTLRVLTGLAAHAESFGYALGLRIVKSVNIASWRKDFIGSQKRGTKRQTLKDVTIERCRQLGFNPRRDDEADAIGILDYACSLNGIIPPWREHEVLRPALGMASA
jgi:hypothetical protein